MMLERQREGIDKAQNAGKYKGRKPIHEEKRAAILCLAGEGMTKVEIAKQLGVGQATVYRSLLNYEGVNSDFSAVPKPPIPIGGLMHTHHDWSCLAV